MPKINITLLDRNNRFLELLATIFETTKSQIMNDILDTIHSDDLESTFWDDWENASSEYQEFVDSVSSSEDKKDEDDEDEEDDEE